MVLDSLPLDLPSLHHYNLDFLLQNVPRRHCSSEEDPRSTINPHFSKPDSSRTEAQSFNARIRRFKAQFSNCPQLED